MVKYLAIIEKAKGNYSAYCPDLPIDGSIILTKEAAEKILKILDKKIKNNIIA